MKQIAISIKDRLQNKARAEQRPLNELLEQFVLARVLARLSNSRFHEQFILKGAQLFNIWAEIPHRPTRDADFLSFGSPDTGDLKRIFEEICNQDTDPKDGLEWTEPQVAPIREDNIYGGVRIKFFGLLGKVRIPVQIDVGFGDSITPNAQKVSWDMPLDFPPVILSAYCPETTIAEKLQAAVVLETGNSRMKDFFDLYWLCQHMEFVGINLREAIEATFIRRDTPLPNEALIAFTELFYSRPDKQLQWKAFLRKSNLEPLELEEVIKEIATFLYPVLLEDIGKQIWEPGTGWRKELRRSKNA